MFSSNLMRNTNICYITQWRMSRSRVFTYNCKNIGINITNNLKLCFRGLQLKLLLSVNSDVIIAYPLLKNEKFWFWRNKYFRFFYKAQWWRKDLKCQGLKYQYPSLFSVSLYPFLYITLLWFVNRTIFSFLCSSLNKWCWKLLFSLMCFQQTKEYLNHIKDICRLSK